MNKVYQIVTDNILALLDKGVVPWRKGWKVRGGSIPLNAWGRPYRGINVFILATAQVAAGYRSRYWLTFKQVSERGGRVNEGEKSTLVVFWTLLNKKDTTGKVVVNSKGKVQTIPMLRYFLVFNLDQTEGVKLTRKQQTEASLIENETVDAEVEWSDDFTDAEAIIGTYLSMDNAPKFIEAGSQPAYTPRTDSIMVPVRSDFASPAEYFAAVFHEFSHSTGHESRLNREGVIDFDHYGSGKYGAEELVAEFGAAFLCAEAGVDNTVENSAAYIGGWSERIKADPTLIVKAAGQAQKAADYILGTTFEQSEEE